MKIIKELKEGESVTSTFVGYKKISYRSEDDKELNSIRISIYLKWFIIKLEIIPI